MGQDRNVSMHSKKTLLYFKCEEGMDLDDLLPQIGEFGKYQKLLLWLVCLPACIPCGFCAFNQLFMSNVPDHWCKVPTLMNLSIELRKEIAIPRTFNESYSRCTRYKVDWLEDTNLFEYDSFSLLPNENWTVEPCLDGWEYDTAELGSSIVTEFDLVCSRDIYPTIALAALNMGGPIGVYFFGILNDRIGRKWSYFCCLATLILGGILTGFANNFWTWTGCRLFVGLTVPAVYQIPFIISLELVGPNYRSFITVLTCLFYTLGLILLAGVTYLIRNWRHLAFSTSVPFITYFLYIFFLPESPRWLLAKGRLEEANNILVKLARVNGEELPDSFKLKLKQRMMLQRTESELNRLKEGPGAAALCRTPNMRLKTLLITFNWFANEMVYVGLSYYGPSFGSEEHLSFFLSCVVEIPSYLWCMTIMDRWGRRWPLCVCMVLSGISCIVTVLLPDDASTWTLILFLFSKLTISASFLIIYPFAGELYPTQLRGIGIGTSAYIGGLGLILIPFITYLGRENLVLPLVVMGVISVIGGVTSLRLPETLHQKLPQSVEEGEEFGKDFGINDCLRCIPLRPSRIESYEELTVNNENIELKSIRKLDSPLLKKKTVNKNKLKRQASLMETNSDPSGVMQMTYWF